MLLYAEDSLSDRFIVGRIWKRITGSEPVFVDDGVELVEYLEGCAEGRAAWPRMVLLDLNMPRMNGYEVLERVKTDPRLVRVPVVVLSTSSRQEDVRACLDLHANGYLVKDFDPGELTRTLERAHEFWFQWCAEPDHS